jgi:hypothetical protein
MGCISLSDSIAKAFEIKRDAKNINEIIFIKYRSLFRLLEFYK